MDDTEAKGVGAIVARFGNFEKLIGGSLIKWIYYAGLVGIAIYTLIMLWGAFELLDYSPKGFLITVLLTAVFAVFGTVTWRLTCELWIVIFKILERLGEIRDRLPPAP